MRQSSGPLVYVFAIASMCTLQAQAQNSAELPDAPSPIALNKIAQPNLPSFDRPTISHVDVAASIRSRIEAGGFALTAEGTNETAAYQPAGPGLTQSAHLDLTPIFRSMNRPGADSATEQGGDGGTSEHYHWKGLLWESFAFFGVENIQRLVADPTSGIRPRTALSGITTLPR